MGPFAGVPGAEAIPAVTARSIATAHHFVSGSSGLPSEPVGRGGPGLVRWLCGVHT